VLPDDVVFRMTRHRNVLLQRGLYKVSKARPALVRNAMVRLVELQLRGASDIANFTPRYDPWDERLCIVPNGDLFKALRNGSADVVTDRVERFTPTGIKLGSGAELEADIIVTATGLIVQMLGGAEADVDGEPITISDRLAYKSTMLEGVPNAVVVFGYTNASWTLKADLAAEYACRLINHMDKHGYDTAVAEATEADRGAGSVLDGLSSGYVRRAEGALPQQGARGPWVVRQDYLRDIPRLRYGAIEDGVLQFTKASAPTGSRPRVPA
jgi:cation diffusion facilitator CzcD-associated flavoprotein CzcO